MPVAEAIAAIGAAIKLGSNVIATEKAKQEYIENFPVESAVSNTMKLIGEVSNNRKIVGERIRATINENSELQKILDQGEQQISIVKIFFYIGGGVVTGYAGYHLVKYIDKRIKK